MNVNSGERSSLMSLFWNILWIIDSILFNLCYSKKVPASNTPLCIGLEIFGKDHFRGQDCCLSRCQWISLYFIFYLYVVALLILFIMFKKVQVRVSTTLGWLLVQPSKTNTLKLRSKRTHVVERTGITVTRYNLKLVRNNRYPCGAILENKILKILLHRIVWSFKLYGYQVFWIWPRDTVFILFVRRRMYSFYSWCSNEQAHKLARFKVSGERQRWSLVQRSTKTKKLKLRTHKKGDASLSTSSIYCTSTCILE